MARSAAVVIENNFIKGLVTEATGLNFPENACTETYDCVFDERGKVTRRLGIDYEDDYVLNSLSSSITDKVLDDFVWTDVAGRGDLTFVVIQFGDKLYFFQTNETEGLSDNLLFSVALTTFTVSGAPSPESKECSFASGNGALFVTHPYLYPFYVTYDADAQTHTETQLDFEIRDLAGVEDNLDVDNRPSTLSALHKYNLYNQGWYAKADCDNDGSGDVSDNKTPSSPNTNVLSFWDTERADYPSNSDIWWTMRNAYELFLPKWLADRSAFKGNSKAPNGHYILNPFYQDRTAASGIAGLTVVTSGYQRPSVCAFHANRLFTGGTQAADYSNKIYFSQIVEDEKQYGKCYQSNDLTSEDINDLLPTDGGVIAILGAGTIYNLVSVLNFLLVFASNGIWSISGSQGAAFAANDYSIDKIADISTQSSQSFVMVNGFPVWWNSDGIFTVVFDQVAGTMQVKSLTDKTIRTFYDSIPLSSKIHAKGSYNTRTKVIQWTYRSTNGTTLAEYHQHDRVLIYNTLTEAFYPWKINQVSSSTGPFISGAFCTKGLGTIRQGETVTDSTGVTVTDSGSNVVTISATSTSYLSSAFRYITVVKDSGTYKLTFSQEKDDDYVDWATVSDIDYTSYLLSGFKVHGQGSMKFQSNYLTIFMDQEEDASCSLQAWWDYTNTVNSGRVSTHQQVYHDDSEFSVSQRRIKIRGQGRALQYKLYSSAGSPFTILGWSGFETGNSAP